MKTRTLIGTLAFAGVALGIGQFGASALPGDGGTADGQAGPDVIVGAIPDVTKYGANTVNGVNWMAYAFGSTSCNIGSQQLDWYGGTNRHPVIPQNAYRIMNGRIEQVGSGWMKYGFCALQQTLCGSCTPAGSGCPSLLGIGCSDPYSSSLNGTQSGLGPRSRVNVSTGYFPADTSTETASWPTIPSGQSTIGRRVQIKESDLNPALNPNAVYLAECQYVHPQDASFNNDNNNASYRVFTVGTLSSGAYTLTLTGSTFQQKSAIYHWPSVTPGALVAAADAADGRYLVGFNVTQNADGTWHYEYAIHNLNSDSAASSLSIPLPANVVVTNAGFKDVPYHSGEAYDGTDWAITTVGGAIRWQCTQTYAQNANANALRWGTLYNFWFDASSAPTTGTGAIGIFKTGATLDFAGKVPSNPCRVGDFDCNGAINGSDLAELLNGWGLPGSTDLDGNNVTNGADLAVLLSSWG